MWKSSSERYGRVAIAIHWTSALLIIALMIAGVRAADMTDLAAKASLLRIHAPIGTAVLVLTLGRIVWWLFADRKPDEPVGVPHLQSIAAKAVHILFYVAVLGLAGSGIAMIQLSGAGEILFGTAPGPLPDFWDYTPRYGHAAMATLMAILLALHIGAALYHQFILKDRLLSRMGIGR
jgi:cytochrome b561